LWYKFLKMHKKNYQYIFYFLYIILYNYYVLYLIANIWYASIYIYIFFFNLYVHGHIFYTFSQIYILCTPILYIFNEMEIIRNSTYSLHILFKGFFKFKYSKKIMRVDYKIWKILLRDSDNNNVSRNIVIPNINN